MGFTPNYVAGVWMGYEIPKAMSGGNACPKIWKSVMQTIHEGETIKTINEPDGLVKRTICQISGRVASKSCGTTRVEYFKEGTQPMKYCSSHSSYGASLDDNSNTSSAKKSSKPSSKSTAAPDEELHENNNSNVSPGTSIPNEEVTPDDSSTEGSEDTWYGDD